MRFDPKSRRMFLTGLGGTLLAVPFLPSLLPRAMRKTVEAQPMSAPKRFVAIKSYNGAPVVDYWPTNAPSGYSTHGRDGTVRLDAALPVATGRHSSGNQYFGHAAPLSDFASTGISNVFGAEFNRFADNMLLLRGLDFMPNLNHNHGGFLGNLGLRTNGVGGPLGSGAQINATIDYVISRSSSVYPTAPSGPRVLHLGSRTNTCSYAPTNLDDPLATGMGAIQQAQAYTNPRVAFDTLFGGMMAPPDGPPAGPSVASRLIDGVIDDYRRARDGRHISSADRDLLEQHIAHLTELEASLGGGPSMVTCDTSSPPSGLDTGGEFEVGVAEITQLWDQMVDVLVLALACDATRIATLDVTKMVIQSGGEEFGMGDSENPNSAGRSNWHLQAHNWDDNARRWLGAGNRWIAEYVIIRMLERMEAVTEIDGNSLLHHSLALWGNELSFNHLSYSMPTALFGRCGGAINSGRYIDYIDHDRPVRFSQHDGGVIEGVQYNRLLVTVMQAMGLSPEEYERDPGRGFGELGIIGKDPGAWAVDYDDSNVGEALPDVLT